MDTTPLGAQAEWSAPSILREDAIDALNRVGLREGLPEEAAAANRYILYLESELTRLCPAAPSPEATPAALSAERLKDIRALQAEWREYADKYPHRNQPHLATTYAGELLAEVDRLKTEAVQREEQARELSREVEVLRRFGNKDCLAQADEYLAASLGIDLNETP